MKLSADKYGGRLSCETTSGKASFGYVTQQSKFSLSLSGYNSTCCRGHTMGFQNDGFKYSWGVLTDLYISCYSTSALSLFVRGKKHLTEDTP